jgi:hypothetical protein
MVQLRAAVCGLLLASVAVAVSGVRAACAQRHAALALSRATLRRTP